MLGMKKKSKRFKEYYKQNRNGISDGFPLAFFFVCLFLCYCSFVKSIKKYLEYKYKSKIDIKIPHKTYARLLFFYFK